MKTFLLYPFALATFFSLITPSQVNFRSLVTEPGTISAGVNMNHITRSTLMDNHLLNQELAIARSATARYQTVEEAEADGYVDINFCEPQEGCHWLKPSLLDAHFDPAEPEVLLYVPDDNGRMRLVAVEYLIPFELSTVAPEGFFGDADQWRQEAEGPGFWELTVWLWLNNPNGIFEHHNPRLP